MVEMQTAILKRQKGHRTELAGCEFLTAVVMGTNIV
jgi:hypothetical protein